MLSIVTTTYNRKNTLERLYQSLLKQTNMSFEWIVIDDGSTDNTAVLVEEWLNSKADFDIVFLRKNNGGKHTALNYGIKFVKYDYVLIVDSDDWLLPDAVAYIEEWLNEIQLSEEKCAGVAGMRGKIVERDICPLGQFPDKKKVVKSTNLERRNKKLMGDKAEVYKTELLKRFPFPEILGEKFMPEDVVWNQIALAGYYLKWYPKILYVTEYLPGGLTRSDQQIMFRNNYKGYCLSYYYNWKGLAFPYNYSSAAEFYKKLMKEYGKKETRRLIKEILHVNSFNCLLISLIAGIKGKVR